MEESPKQFIKRLIEFSVGPIIGALIGFVTIPITTYFLLPEQLGKSAMYTMAYSLSTLFVYLGIDQAFGIEFYEAKDRKKLLINCFIIPGVFSIIVTILYLVFYRQISILLFNEIRFNAVLLLALSLPLAIANRFSLLIIRMEEKARLYSFYNISFKLINAIVLIIILMYSNKSFMAIIEAAFISLLITTIMQFVSTYKYWIVKFELDKELIHKLLAFGLPLIPTSLIMWAFNAMDKIAMRNWSNFTQIGLYSAAFKIVAVLGIFQQAFSTFWVPTAYRWHKNNFPTEKFEKVSHILIFCMSLVFILIIMLKDIIIKILGENYSEATTIIPFLLFYPLMYTVSESTTLGIAFSRKTIYNLLISTLSAVVNYIGNFMLVGKYGALGASISTGVSYIVFFWLRTMISRKLWFKFKIGIYFSNILLMLILATINLKYNNFLVNMIFVIILFIINKQAVQDSISIIKVPLRR